MSLVSITQSFIQFVYPFVFEAELFDNAIEHITEQTTFTNDEGQLLPYWDEASFPRDDLLRYVANYLNPYDKKTPPTAKIWYLSSHNINIKGLTSSEGLSVEKALTWVGGAVLLGVCLSFMAYLRYRREREAAKTAAASRPSSSFQLE